MKYRLDRVAVNGVRLNGVLGIEAVESKCKGGKKRRKRNGILVKHSDGPSGLKLSGGQDILLDDPSKVLYCRANG